MKVHSFCKLQLKDRRSLRNMDVTNITKMHSNVYALVVTNQINSIHLKLAATFKRSGRKVPRETFDKDVPAVIRKRNVS